MAGKGKPFVLGKSGNPSGRPVGARNKTTLAVEALFDGEAEALTRKAIEMALAGDPTALRLCLDRILPPRKGRPVTFDLPAIATAADITTALETIAEAMAAGELTPDEAGAVAGVIEANRRAFDQRLRALEQAAPTGR